jgi:hypothetical protein
MAKAAMKLCATVLGLLIGGSCISAIQAASGTPFVNGNLFERSDTTKMLDLSQRRANHESMPPSLTRDGVPVQPAGPVLAYERQ